MWGPASSKNVVVTSPRKQLPPQPVSLLDPMILQNALKEIDDLLANGSQQTIRQKLLSGLLSLALSRDPAVGEALSLRLKGPFPEMKVRLFGGIYMQAKRMIQWYFLYAIGLNGHGRVPPELITTPWSSTPNRAEKYLETSVAAAWAAGQLGQTDQATLEALTIALNGNLPEWAKRDILAVLHLLEQPFDARK